MVSMNSDPSKSSLFPPSSSIAFDFIRSSLLSSGLSIPNNHLKSDRYRFIPEYQTGERDLQFAMMAEAAIGNSPLPLFIDPSSSTLYQNF